MKVIARTEAPQICCVENGSVSVVAYRRILVDCSMIKEAIIALLSTYFIFAIEHDSKFRLFMNFMQFALTGLQAKNGIRLIKQLQLQ